MSGMHRRILASLKDLVINGVPALQAVASAPVSAPEMSTRKVISAVLEFMGAFMWHTEEIHQAAEEEINGAEAAVNSIQQSKLKQNGKNHFIAL
jgi:hypothetical protein